MYEMVDKGAIGRIVKKTLEADLKLIDALRKLLSIADNIDGLTRAEASSTITETVGKKDVIDSFFILNQLTICLEQSTSGYSQRQTITFQVTPMTGKDSIIKADTFRNNINEAIRVLKDEMEEFAGYLKNYDKYMAIYEDYKRAITVFENEVPARLRNLKRQVD